MQVQAINNRGKYNYQQNQNYKKVNPSFTALKSVVYDGKFCPHTFIDDAKIVKGLLNNPAFQKFYTKYDVKVMFDKASYADREVRLYLYCKEPLEDSKPNNMFQKIKNFFKADKEDKRDEYRLYFSSKFDRFNTLSETKLEEEIDFAKERLIFRKQRAEEHAEILKSIKETL